MADERRVADQLDLHLPDVDLPEERLEFPGKLLFVDVGVEPVTGQIRVWAEVIKLSVPPGQPVEHRFPAAFGAYWLLHTLRRALPEAAPVEIVNVHGLGYKLVGRSQHIKQQIAVGILEPRDARAAGPASGEFPAGLARRKATGARPRAA